MKLRSAPINMTWRWALGLLAALGVSILLAATVGAAGIPPAGQTGDAKLAKLHQVDAQATAAAKSWHAPKIKPSASASASGPSSCPRSSLPTGIYSGDTGGFHDYITNYAVVAPTPNRPIEYVIFAGASATNPQQGLIIVVRLNGDPCASGAIGTRIDYHPTPTQQGAVTLTQIAGDTVAFTTASGGSRQFDFVSGQFS